MCACRQKKSFLIADILGDTKKKPYKNLSQEPTKPLVCNKKAPEVTERVNTETYRQNEKPINRNDKFIANPNFIKNSATDTKPEDNIRKYNVITEVDKEIEISKVNLQFRRNTYPLQPTPLKPYDWNYRGKDSSGYMEPRLNYYSEQMLNSSQMLRNQLAANRYVTHPFAIRHSYGFDRVPPNCCAPWWGMGGRRKGGQVRFTAGQTGALERRFNASKYLSPDERRALAATLRLSDRQVKTWFQNRRAKWRRTTPDSADTGSPPTSADGSDDEVQITDDDSVM